MGKTKNPYKLKQPWEKVTKPKPTPPAPFNLAKHVQQRWDKTCQVEGCNEVAVGWYYSAQWRLCNHHGALLAARSRDKYEGTGRQ